MRLSVIWDGPWVMTEWSMKAFRSGGSDPFRCFLAAMLRVRRRHCALGERADELDEVGGLDGRAEAAGGQVSFGKSPSLRLFFNSSLNDLLFFRLWVSLLVCGDLESCLQSLFLWLGDYSSLGCLGVCLVLVFECCVLVLF